MLNKFLPQVDQKDKTIHSTPINDKQPPIIKEEKNIIQKEFVLIPETVEKTIIDQTKNENPEKPVDKIEQKLPTVKKKKSLPRQGKNLVEIGAGYSLSAREDSAYGVIIRHLARMGHFIEMVELLENNSFNCEDRTDVDKLMKLCLVNVDRLEESCRNDPNWEANQNRRTSLGNSKRTTNYVEKRWDEKKWVGNFGEMISTCVGYYSWFISPVESRKSAPNKNVKKFFEAGILMRRVHTDNAHYIVLYPVDLHDKITKSIDLYLKK